MGGVMGRENVCEAASLFSRKRQKLKNKAPTPTPNASSRPLGRREKKRRSNLRVLAVLERACESDGRGEREGVLLRLHM